MSDIRYRPSCSFSSEYGLVASGGLYQYVDSVEHTSGWSNWILHLKLVMSEGYHYAIFQTEGI